MSINQPLISTIATSLIRSASSYVELKQKFNQIHTQQNTQYQSGNVSIRNDTIFFCPDFIPALLDKIGDLLPEIFEHEFILDQVQNQNQLKPFPFILQVCTMLTRDHRSAGPIWCHFENRPQDYVRFVDLFFVGGFVAKLIDLFDSDRAFFEQHRKFFSLFVREIFSAMEKIPFLKSQSSTATTTTTTAISKNGSANT